MTGSLIILSSQSDSTLHLMDPLEAQQTHTPTPSRIEYGGQYIRRISPLRLGIFHDDDIDDVAPLFKMLLQRFVRRPVVEAADENLAEMLRLLRVLEIRWN